MSNHHAGLAVLYKLFCLHGIALGESVSGGATRGFGVCWGVGPGSRLLSRHVRYVPQPSRAKPQSGPCTGRRAGAAR